MTDRTNQKISTSPTLASCRSVEYKTSFFARCLAGLFTLSSLLTATSLRAEPVSVSPAEVVRHWNAHPTAENGRFVELRQIPGFPKPLRSSGHYCAKPGEKIVWAVEKPFATTIEVRRDAMVVTSAQGTTTQSLPSGEAASFLFALVSGDVTKLGNRFELTATLEGDRYTIRATPKSETLKGFLTSLTLSGGKSPERCVIVTPRGETSDITLDPTGESLP